MKLLFKQRFFSWLDSYDIYDEHGNAMFSVKGVLSFGHCLKIYDKDGRELGMIKEEVFTWMPRFVMVVGGREIGQIRKEFTFFKPKFHIDCNGWIIEGDFFEWDYSVMDGSREVMSASKKIWNLTDTYEINVHNEEDVLYSLMIVLAIDAAKCSQNS